MTREEKQLLLKDLCARLVYGVKCYYEKGDGKAPIQTFTIGALSEFANNDNVICKPYLRPMSSMTEEEREYLKHHVNDDFVDYCNEHYLDYRGLIPMGLALEAKEGVYKNL